jgi:6-phosphogluconolactonase
MDMIIVKRLAMIWTLGALALLSSCDHGGDDSPPPPAPAVALPAPAVAISANPATVQLSTASVIAWSSSNSTTCDATGSWAGAKSTSGTESVVPPAAGDATYTLTCTGAGGTANAVATVTVSAPPSPVPTAVLTPQSSTVIIGSSTTLAWWSTDATGCTAGGAWSGAKSASGNETVTPAALGTAGYTLSCTGAGGSIVASATVNAISSVEFLLTANENGNVSVYTLDGSTGVPTEVSGSPFPTGGNTRWVALSPDNRFAYVSNLYEILAYRVDEVSGALTPVVGSPFEMQSSPQGLAFHASGSFLFAATYEGIIRFAVSPTTGALTGVGTPVPGDRIIKIHPSGNFAYATKSSGSDAGVWAYAIGSNGALATVAGSPFAAGVGWHAVAIDPAGRFAYVAEQMSSRIFAFSINASTGALVPVPGSPWATAVGPHSIAINPESAFLYLACLGAASSNGALSGYVINSSTGALTQLPGSPFHTGYSTVIGINRSGSVLYEVGVSRLNVEFRSLAIGGTGSLTDIPGTRQLRSGWSLGMALSR